MKIKAISISDRKGIRKKNIESVRLIRDFGLLSDAHGGKWHRQVSFLAQESIESMRKKGLDVVAGNFAENITTEGVDLPNIPVGTHLKMGDTELAISQLGKICHHKCAIYHQAGDCVMPREGIFGVVIHGGDIKVGDAIEILTKRSSTVAIIGPASMTNETAETISSLLLEKWSPPFVRFDKLNSEESNLSSIIVDLTETQKINHIVLFDPKGQHQLAMMEFTQCGDQCYRHLNSIIYYCRDIMTLQSLDDIKKGGKAAE